MTRHNEDSRVKIPALLHLSRLGYEYLPLSRATWDIRHNIFPDLFVESLLRLNPGLVIDEAQRIIDEIALELENDDLGKAFYERLTSQSGMRLVDLEDFGNNSLHVVTELTCKNGDDEFRPDITLLINGMPLVFIEVKKPNNKDGILAELQRSDRRFSNPKFRRFINITQIIVFSNNQEYDDENPIPIKGAYYATTATATPQANYFREEDPAIQAVVPDITDKIEDLILQDNNLGSIKYKPEFATNKQPGTPTNRLLTSLFSKQRLGLWLRYAIAYLKNDDDGWQKHVMRYPQFFATLAIAEKLDQGRRKGIIWHTQGSGKTALAYYNVKYLTDYFQRQNTIPRFYFIVDRLDLLTQAAGEFSSRGLKVHRVNSREEFATDLRTTAATQNLSGQLEITVVNIQKFKDDAQATQSTDYAVNTQRVYFLDEVHRSYNPQGSFLANLERSDPNAIKIGLTGTPLLGDDTASRNIFGDYIHKYYYNASIADGYTLRLIREEIATRYKQELQDALQQIEVQKGQIPREQLYSHPKFCVPMLDYIVEDFTKARITFNDNSIGGMVVCDSAAQARELHSQFQQRYTELPNKAANDASATVPIAAEPNARFGKPRPQTAALILHDEGSTDIRRDWVNDYKAGKIDLLFVFNMLLTGFDAPRLKKLYLGRVVKDHNLLQTLTRVNRTYQSFRFGYVVDFADISKEFDKTNEAYFEELQADLGDEMESYSRLFKSREEIEADIAAIKDALWEFETDNPEVFRQQIELISDREQLQAIKRALNDARSLHNLIRLFGYDELIERLDFHKLNLLLRETTAHISNLNLKNQLEHAADSTALLNQALEDTLFLFEKLSETELKLADELKDTLRRTRETLAGNFDPQDPEFISLKEELERLFKKKQLNEVSQTEMQTNMTALNRIDQQGKALNAENERLALKYKGDRKYARLHKRLMASGRPTDSPKALCDLLMGIKAGADTQVLSNSQILRNDAYFEQALMPDIIKHIQSQPGMKPDPADINTINKLLTREYLDEYNGVTPW